MNALPKYNVSSALEHCAWNNSTVFRGDILDEVPKLKHELNGDIAVPASFQLVHTLMEHDLADGVRLKVFPVVLGVGQRLFRETSDKKPMRLIETQTLEAGVVYLIYQFVRRAQPAKAESIARAAPPISSGITWL
ncbi:MAG TPA: dihydrofolate reductase family protein [Candidatus Saccharimonadales bacterium]|nr:dihydrofolate reductase family protein [Candidatus Saccharimonadales bacterium]